MNFDDFDLPVGGIESLKNSLEMIKRLREIKQQEGEPVNKDEEIAFFFSHALTPFYDCMWDGMKTEAGHIVYRLSDRLDKSFRETIMIYPRSSYSGGGWNTLEDWRKEWEKLNPEGIPEFTKMLEEFRGK